VETPATLWSSIFLSLSSLSSSLFLVLSAAVLQCLSGRYISQSHVLHRPALLTREVVSLVSVPPQLRENTLSAG